VRDRLGAPHAGHVDGTSYMLPFPGMPDPTDACSGRAVRRVRLILVLGVVACGDGTGVCVWFALPPALEAQAALEHRDLSRELLRHPEVVPTRFSIVPVGGAPPPASVLPTITVRVPPFAPVPTLEVPGASGGGSAATTVLALGATPQDVLVVLGAPNSAYVLSSSPWARELLPPGSAPAAAVAGPTLLPARGGTPTWPLPPPLQPTDVHDSPAEQPPGGYGGAPPMAAVATPPLLQERAGVGGVAVTPDYVYHYLDRGLDVVFDGRTLAARAWVLHTNCLGHPDFARYRKCQYRLLMPPIGAHAVPPAEGADEVVLAVASTPSPSPSPSPSPAVASPATPASIADLLGVPELAPGGRAALGAAGGTPTSENRAPPDRGLRPVVVGPDTPWEDIRRELTRYAGTPALGTAQDHSAHACISVSVCMHMCVAWYHRLGGMLDPPLEHAQPLHANPFGPSFFCGAAHVAFEVVRQHDLCATVTVFTEPSAPMP
jgi:hypothetical protein